MKRRRVAIVGVGTTAFRSVTPDVSYRELTYEAAVKAYTDAGVAPKEIDAFVTTAEDFLEGYSISDEYAPDQVGGALRPVQTIPGDAIQSLATAYMMVLTGQYDIVAVQALSKASNMLTINEMMNFALDPVLNRPLDEVAHFIAGLEMSRYMFESGTTKEQCARVAVKNRRNALLNPLAAYGCDMGVDNLMASPPVSIPLSALDIAQHADGAVVLVLAAEDRISALDGIPIWIEGVGWTSEAASLESRDWGAASTTLAARMAFEQAGMTPGDIDFAEVCDEYTFKELQHIEALELCEPGQAGHLLETGETAINGSLPINPSGGALGVGHLFECSGAQRLAEVCIQLRGQAGARQVQDADVGLAHSWRGVPSTTAAVAILAAE